MAAGHFDGLVGSLGFSNRASRFREGIDGFFANRGSLGGFVPVGEGILQRHMHKTQDTVQMMYDCDHSNNQTCANQEDVPGRAYLFFRLFEEIQNQETRTAHAARVQNERRNVASSLAGCQAPLGNRGNGPAELCTETSGNIGAPALQSQVVVNVNEERRHAEYDTDALIEGRNNAENYRPAPCGRTKNGVCQCSIHLGGFRAGKYDPSSRFNNIVQGYQALDGLTQTISQFIAAPQQGPPC